MASKKKKKKPKSKATNEKQKSEQPLKEEEEQAKPDEDVVPENVRIIEDVSPEEMKEILGEEAVKAAAAERGGEKPLTSGTISEEMEKLISERDDYLERLKRSQAEFANYQKRTVREREITVNRMLGDFVMKLLDALDDMDRALGAGGEKPDVDAMLDGFRLIREKITRILDDSGVKVIDALEKPFDPAFHEAVMMELSENHDVQTVIEVFQDGYVIGEHVIRPARVKVANPAPGGPSKAADEVDEEKNDEREKEST